MRRSVALLILGVLFILPSCGVPHAVGNFFSGGADYFKDKKLACTGKVVQVVDGDFGRRWVGVQRDRLLQKEGLYTYFGHEASSNAGDRLDSQMQAEVVALNPRVAIDDLEPGESYFAPKECHLVTI